MNLTYIKPERILLKDASEFNEKWVQDRIKDDPSLLGLGDLEIKAAERMHPKAGRLDMLLRDPESDKRYELELMLGTVDESHIVEYAQAGRQRIVWCRT
jgi:hypothetical protein